MLPFADIHWSHFGIALPFGLTPGDRPFADGARIDVFADEATWHAYKWNPPEYMAAQYPDADPDASPKPTWEELRSLRRRSELRADESDHIIGRASHRVRSALTDAAHLPRPIAVYIGEGLDHMTGLARLAAAADRAGAQLPHIVMRDTAEKRVSLHRTGPLAEVLDAAAARENLVESAHNALMEDYHAQAAIRDDETAELDAREAAADKARDIAENYADRLEAAMAAYDPDALPAELTELKATYIERLEAAAMRRVKALRGVVSQQGVDLPASCADEAEAAEAVAREERLGALAVLAAGDAAGAKTAYEAALAKIAAVTPLHVPELFDAGGEAVTADIAATAAVKLEARQPAGQDIPGPVAVVVSVPGYVAGAFTAVAEERGQDGAFTRATIALSMPDNAGETAEYRVEARNLCGPARALTVKITRPAA